MRVRAARPADADAIAAIYAPYVLLGTASFEEEPPDAGVVVQRMAASEHHPWLVAEDDHGATIAYSYASPFHARRAYRWTVETSVYVVRTAHGRGVGRRLYAALLDTLVGQGFVQAVTRISLPGHASVALHEAMGFTSTGVQRAVGYKHGQWIDVGLWQRPLADLANPPAEPRAAQLLG